VDEGRWISASDLFEGHEAEATDHMARIETERREQIYMTEKRRVSCDECDFTTDWPPALAMHKRGKHEGGPIHEATVSPPTKGHARLPILDPGVVPGPALPAPPPVHGVLDEAKALHDLKRDGYGTDADPLANYHSVAEFGIAPSAYVIQRIGEKLNRLKAALRGSVTVDIEEELADITLCGAIAIVLYREENP
jgi:hypothetical protein